MGVAFVMSYSLCLYCFFSKHHEHTCLQAFVPAVPIFPDHFRYLPPPPFSWPFLLIILIDPLAPVEGALPELAAHGPRPETGVPPWPPQCLPSPFLPPGIAVGRDEGRLPQALGSGGRGLRSCFDHPLVVHTLLVWAPPSTWPRGCLLGRFPGEGMGAGWQKGKLRRPSGGALELAWPAEVSSGG